MMPLSEIAKQTSLNKSKLAYYFKLGLLLPESAFPDIKLFLFDITNVKKRIKQINDLRKRGYKLAEMKDKFK